MATETLVSFDIENGKEVFDALDRDGKTPNVALWAKIPDYEDWRLVIASDRLDQSSSRSGYTEINEAIKKAGISIHRQPTISMRSMDNPFIRDLRRVFASTADTYGMRLGARSLAANIWKTPSFIASVEGHSLGRCVDSPVHHSCEKNHCSLSGGTLCCTAGSA
jgi:hypothetical protein